MDKSLIVVATDFSDEAVRAYAPTFELAKTLKADVVLLHVVVDQLAIPYGAVLAPPQSEPDLAPRVDAARKKIEELAKGLAPAGVTLRTEVISAESPEKALCDWAQQHGARYIALATHGRSGLKRVVLGSFAEAILHHAVTPLLLYPRPS